MHVQTAKIELPMTITPTQLDELEIKARAAIAAEANAPVSLEGFPLITPETVNASWNYREAIPPTVTLQLIAIARAARSVMEMFDDPNTGPWWGIAGADARAVLRDALADGSCCEHNCRDMSEHFNRTGDIP